VQVYGPLYRSLVLPAWETGFRRRPTLRHLRFLRCSERWPPEQLAAFQDAELRKLVAHAYANIPFYRRRFDTAGVAPGDVCTAADLARIPLLTRADAQGSERERASQVPPLPTIRKTTSGSTGQPLAFGYDEGSEWWRQAVRMRGYGWAGYRQGDRVLHYWSMRPPRRYASRLWRTVDHAWVTGDRLLRHESWADSNFRSEDRFAQVVDLIRRTRPTAIVCYSQGGADLARYVVATGARTWGTIPVLCGAEPLYPGDRRTLQAAFGEAVFETYGSREVMLIATECEAHRGLHVQAENLVVEVVVRDEDGGERPAAPGEAGEVVLTDLHNYGMPFIRYVCGDLAVAADGKPCPCGRALPLIAGVVGRNADTLVDGSGRRVGGSSLMTLFVELAPLVRRYQAIQHRDRSLTLRIVAEASFDGAARAQIERYVEHYLPGVPVMVETVDEIPLDANGKRRFILAEHD
jgi:phenylacetate-CoA ligase